MKGAIHGRGEKKKKKKKGKEKRGGEQALTTQTKQYFKLVIKHSADTHKLVSRIPMKDPDAILPDELAQCVELPALALQSTFYGGHNTTFHPHKHRQNMGIQNMSNPSLTLTVNNKSTKQHCFSRNKSCKSSVPTVSTQT